jgi:DNA modification methylase
MSQPAPLKVKQIPVDELHNAPWNANRVPEDVLAKVRRSIADFGVVENLVARERPDGGYEVISGNHRLGIYREMGVTKAPVHVVDVDDAHARILAQTLNRTRGQDDAEAYAALLTDVLAEMDIEQVLAYLPESEKTITQALDAVGAPADDSVDDVPDLPDEPDSKPGEVYDLGPHRLVCGDSESVEALDLLMNGETAGCVLTDPPYGISLDTGKRHTGLGGLLNGTPVKEYRPVANDDRPFDAGFLYSYLAAAKEQFWFGANYYRRTIPDDDLSGSWLVWDKRNEATDVVHGSGFELVWSRQKHKQDLLRFFHSGAFGAEARNRYHPTQKPVALLAEILGRWSPKGCVVVDPFGGSGSTLLAAERCGMRAFLVELDPGYCDVIRKRWEQHNG